MLCSPSQVPFYAATVARARLARFRQRLVEALASPSCVFPPFRCVYAHSFVLLCDLLLAETDLT